MHLLDFNRIGRHLPTVAVVAILAATGSKGARADSADLPNFHSVSPGIYRGAAPTESGLRKLKQMGVRTVIDLRIAPKTVKKEKQLAESLGFKWINLPMSDQPPTQAQVDTLLGALRGAKKEPVFVHCQHGADRTGCMLGIYRESMEGWDYDKTYKEMLKYGFKPHLLLLSGAVKKRAAKGVSAH
jgi:protein tyrosine/serine phosphatase